MTNQVMTNRITLDAIDRKILKYLIRNARTPFLEIARECNISGAAIHQRIRKLNDAGVICGSRLIVDPRMLGFDVCAYIGIRIESTRDLESMQEALENIPEIVECHFITGNYSLFAKVYCLDNSHLMRVLNTLQSIPGITSTETRISLKETLQRQIHVDCLKD